MLCLLTDDAVRVSERRSRPVAAAVAESIGTEGEIGIVPE